MSRLLTLGIGALAALARRPSREGRAAPPLTEVWPPVLARTRPPAAPRAPLPSAPPVWAPVLAPAGRRRDHP